MIITQLSEVFDRFTIVELKKLRLSENDGTFLKEYASLKKEVYAALKDFPELKKYLQKLRLINAKIWNLESDIRSFHENKIGLLEVGRRAIKIRDLNGQRIHTKNAITKLVGQGFKETKIDHASGQVRKI